MNDICNLKLLLVDDETELLRMVETILHADGFSRVFSANNCTNAIDMFRTVQPDCLILDVTLPDGDGFSLLGQIRRESQVPVLFLSARDEDENRVLGLGLGADDYIVKPFLPKELTLRLRAILRRAYAPPQFADAVKATFILGGSVVDLNTATVRKDRNDVALTAKEYVLLEKLYENRGRIVTLDSLCQAAWGDGFSGYENTLMVHIRRLREKIEAEPSKPRYLLTVRGLGYKLVTEEKS